MENQKKRIEMTNNRIFLSHKGIGKETVRKYRDVLSAMGFRPWTDEMDRPDESSSAQRIPECLAGASAAVFFVTPSNEDKVYLCPEIDRAVQQKTARGKDFSIITLALSNEHGVSGRVPDLLAKYVWKKPKTHLEGIRYIVEAHPPRH